MPITYVLIAASENPTSSAFVSQETPNNLNDWNNELSVAPHQSAPNKLVQTIPTPANMLAAEQSEAGQAGNDTENFSRQQSPLWMRFMPLMVCAYAAGVVLMLVRLSVSILRANRFGVGATIITTGLLHERLRSLAEKLSLRFVPALAVVKQNVMPKVIGLVRPTILLPASAITGLSQDELELILVHELAHIRRHDMWVNLVQRLAEALLFFNPALWYLSRRISTLREYCCDEMACKETAAQSCSNTTPESTTSESATPKSAATVATELDCGGEPRARYAVALLRIVELSHAEARTEIAALAANGRSPSELRKRVSRLFGEPLRDPFPVTRRGVLTVLAIVLLLASPVAWNRHAQPPEPTPTVEPAEPTAELSTKQNIDVQQNVKSPGPVATLPPKDAEQSPKKNPADKLPSDKLMARIWHPETEE
jgi:beta-lactamase regulating signal transducer with metallopeptidase domain